MAVTRPRKHLNQLLSTRRREKKRAIGEVEGAAATLQSFSVPPEMVDIVEGDDNQKGMEVGLGRKRARQGKENEPPANSSRVAAPPESSQESAHLPEEGMSGTCSEFPDFAKSGATRAVKSAIWIACA